MQAIAAGGIVLGIGAVVTLAAWNDSEFAWGGFGSASFNLEGSTDGENFDDNSAIDEAALLNFNAENMTPGQTVYTPFWIRLDAETTVGGTIEAADGIAVASSEGANTAALSYTVYADPDACSSSGVSGGNVVASADSLSEGVGSTTSLSLSAGAEGDPGEATMLCFAVQAHPEDLVQGDSSEVIWEIVATSLEG